MGCEAWISAIRAFISLSSSHTEGALVEMVEPVSFASKEFETRLLRRALIVE